MQKLVAKIPSLETLKVGEITAQSIREFFARPETRKVIEKLKRAGVNMKSIAAPAPRGGPIKGKTLVVTGTLTKYSREAMEEKIRSLGGKAASSVSGATDYLVVGDSPGKKLQKAQDLSVPVLTEAEFEKLVGPQ